MHNICIYFNKYIKNLQHLRKKWEPEVLEHNDRTVKTKVWNHHHFINFHGFSDFLDFNGVSHDVPDSKNFSLDFLKSKLFSRQFLKFNIGFPYNFLNLMDLPDIFLNLFISPVFGI